MVPRTGRRVPGFQIGRGAASDEPRLRRAPGTRHGGGDRQHPRRRDEPREPGEHGTQHAREHRRAPRRRTPGRGSGRCRREPAGGRCASRLDRRSRTARRPRARPRGGHRSPERGRTRRRRCHIPRPWPGRCRRGRSLPRSRPTSPRDLGARTACPAATDQPPPGWRLRAEAGPVLLRRRAPGLRPRPRPPPPDDSSGGRAPHHELEWLRPLPAPRRPRAGGRRAPRARGDHPPRDAPPGLDHGAPEPAVELRETLPSGDPHGWGGQSAALVAPAPRRRARTDGDGARRYPPLAGTKATGCWPRSPGPRIPGARRGESNTCSACWRD